MFPHVLVCFSFRPCAIRLSLCVSISPSACLLLLPLSCTQSEITLPEFNHVSFCGSFRLLRVPWLPTKFFSQFVSCCFFLILFFFYRLLPGFWPDVNQPAHIYRIKPNMVAVNCVTFVLVCAAKCSFMTLYFLRLKQKRFSEFNQTSSLPPKNEQSQTK